MADLRLLKEGYETVKWLLESERKYDIVASDDELHRILARFEAKIKEAESVNVN